MEDRDRPKTEFTAELAELRKRVVELETSLTKAQQAEAEHQQINDCLPVLVATAGTDGYYKKVNAAFERVLGWTEEESLSRPFMEFIHPDDRATAAAVFEQLKSGETICSFEDRNVCKDGSYRWISWTVVPVPNRDIVYGIGEDITERKQAVETLRRTHNELEQRVEQRTIELAESNRKLLDILDSITDGFASFDNEWRYTYVNRAAAEYLRKPAEELLGETVWDMFPAAAELKFYEAFHRAIQEGVAVHFDEYYPTPLDAWFECHCYPSGEGMVLYFRDVTDRRRAGTGPRKTNALSYASSK